ncbi:RDD family protein [Chitinophaga sp.]|uniref:RDD family protein n=1 Tax=Chitinophaga sp. TaxID=1869181 RepID=UPI0031CE7DEF
MPIIKIPTVFNIDLEFERADLGRRAVAYFIDLLARVAFLLLGIYLISKMGLSYKNRDVMMFALVVVPVSLYYLFFEILMKGQSPGKKAMNIKVVSLLGNTPSVSQILLRWMFRLVESPLLSLAFISATLSQESAFVAIIWLAVGVLPIIIVVRSDYNQRLGDIAAGTILVVNKQRHSIHDTIFREIDQEDYVPRFPQILRLSDRDLSKIKAVLDNAGRTRDTVMAVRIADKVKSVLHIESDMDALAFLETLLNDYNYLVTRK